jgi:azurin
VTSAAGAGRGARTATALGRGVKLSRRGFAAMGLVATSAVLAACSAGTGSSAAAGGATSTGPDPDETGLATVDIGASLSDPPGTVSLEIGTATGAKEFRYDPASLQVPADARVKVKLSNNTDPKDEIGHNWVLVAAGTEAAVLASGKAAGDDKDWLDTGDPAIIAHTRLIEGGQTNTIRFTAPPAGSYPYLCTFPEHYAGGEKGTLVVS